MASIQDNVLNLTSLVENLNKELDSHVDKLELGAQAVQKYNKEFAKTPSEYVKVLSTAKQRVDELDKSTSKMVMTSKQMEAQSIKESNARNSLNKQREVSIRQAEIENEKLANISNTYNKTQSQINNLTKVYNDLSIRKARYNNLNENEEKRLITLANVTQKYNTVLKTTDYNVGKFGRNVGNYSFDPLRNSISRVAQELPNLGQSFQIFAMSIGNNFAQVKEAIDGIIQKNKELKAAGEPVKSVFKEVTASIFSLNTAIYLGIALFIAYSKEIGNFTSKLFGANEILKTINEETIKYNKAKVSGIAQFKNEKATYDDYLYVLENEKSTLREKKIAIEKLKSLYPEWLSNLKDEQILKLKGSDVDKKIREEFFKKAQYDTKKKETEDLALKIEQYKSEIIARTKFKEESKRLSEELRKIEEINFKSFQKTGKRVDEQAQIDALARVKQLFNLEKQRKESIKDLNISELSNAKIKQLITSLEKGYSKALEANNKLKLDSILLEGTVTDAEDKRILRLKKINQELADYAKSDYEYRKTILENLRDNNKKVADDEKETLNDRINAYNVYIEQKKQLAQLENNRAIELIDKEFNDGTDEINKKYNERLQEIKDAENDTKKIYVNGAVDRKLALEIKENEITALNKKVTIDRNLITEKFVQGQKELADEYVNEVAYKLLQSFDKLDKQNEISQQKLNDLSNRNATGGTLDYSAPLSSFKKYYDDRARIEEEAKISSLTLELNIKNKRLLELGATGKIESEEYKKLTAEKILTETQLQEIKDANQEKNLKHIEEQKKALMSYFDSFKSDLLSGFNMKSLDIFFKIEENGKSAFENLLETAKKSGKEMQFVFATTLEVAQEMYNKLSEASQANFDAEYERLDRQTEFAMGLAGKNEKAKERIQEQADAKRREIQKREWKAKQQLALVNIAIDTAQAIATTYGQMGWIGGTAGAVFLAAMGAAQIALVASQKMPAFWKGTDNAPEGFAMVDELRPEVHTDKQGNIKSLGSSKGANVRYLEKGDKIYKSHTDYINKELSKNGINPMGSFMNFTLPTEIKGNDFSEVKQEISKLADVIKNKEAVSINIDEAGFRTKIGGAEILNSRQKFIKRSV